MVRQLNNEADFNAALEAAGDKTVFVDFTATWCGPCKQIGPVFASLAKKHEDAVFVKVDVDVNKRIAAQYGIQAMPTFIAVKNKNKIGKVLGADPSKLAKLVLAKKGVAGTPTNKTKLAKQQAHDQVVKESGSTLVQVKKETKRKQGSKPLDGTESTKKSEAKDSNSSETKNAGKRRHSTSSQSAGEQPSAKKSKGESADEPLHPFKHDPADDCETCLRAYQDISPFLTKLAQRLGKPKEELCIWDPYYCAGQVKTHLRKLGYKNVVNENQDFYALIENDTMPPFDVLMTSPPYSRDHIERCVEFAVACGKPFFLLMPQYVHRKAYYSGLVDGLEPFFMYPTQDYVYYAHHGGRKDNTQVPCRHWVRDGKCPKGTSCNFLHADAPPPQPQPVTRPDGTKTLTAVTPFKSVWHLHCAKAGVNTKLFTWAVHKLRKSKCKLVRTASELPLPSSAS